MLPFAIYNAEIRFRNKLLSFQMSVPSGHGQPSEDPIMEGLTK